MSDLLLALDDLAASNSTVDAVEEIATANLICASGLPGTESLEIGKYLSWLDEAAEQVELETKRNYHKFLAAPNNYQNSQARFCAICLITVMQRQFGVGYNPKWQGLKPDSPTPESFGIDPSDLFIHAIMDGCGGTCGSLPVLYVAVGRRLGYPLYLVKAARHLFMRWDDPEGRQWHHAELFNIEATGPGVHFLTDDFYRTWPRTIALEDISAGIFLRSLSPREERAEFLATRGYCLRSNRRYDAALNAFSAAAELSPHNYHFVIARESLRMHLAMRQRGHGFLNAPYAGPSQEAVGPFWMEGFGGRKLLVQIVSPVTQPFHHGPEIGRPLYQQTLRTPNGMHVEVWLPMQSLSTPLSAHWISLSDGRQALVHAPADRHPLRMRHSLDVGQAVVPAENHRAGAHRIDAYSQERAELAFHEAGYLGTQIEQTARLMEEKTQTAGLPHIDPLAISVNPNIPSLTASHAGVHLIH